MKKKLLAPISIILGTIIVVTSLFYVLNEYINRKKIDTINHALTSLIDLQAQAVYNSYFVWTKVYELANQGMLSDVYEITKEITDVFPLIDSVEINQGPPPSENYKISLDGELLRIEYAIHDDDEQLIVQNAYAVTVLQTAKLLKIVSPDEFQIDAVHGQKSAYGIPISARAEMFNVWNISFLVVSSALIIWILLQRYRKKTSLFLNTQGLESIIYLFEQTEKASASHSRNVAILALFAGKKLGFSGNRLRNLYIAALLHDIGKIGVPTNIITKTGKLDSKEFVQMKQHPVISARILKSFKEFESLSTFVLYHHEREDGSGYPEGLKASEIPAESKIIAVVDVFEALVGERPYRNPIHPSSAFEKMRGMPLDQHIVSILIDSYGELGSFKPPSWVLSHSPWMLSA